MNWIFITNCHEEFFQMNKCGRFGLHLKWVMIRRHMDCLTGVCGCYSLLFRSYQIFRYFTQQHPTVGARSTFPSSAKVIIRTMKTMTLHLPAGNSWKQSTDTPTVTSSVRCDGVSLGGCDFILVSKPNSELVSEDSLPSCVCVT